MKNCYGTAPTLGFLRLSACFVAATAMPLRYDLLRRYGFWLNVRDFLASLRRSVAARNRLGGP
jgi:hypothetical protein